MTRLGVLLLLLLAVVGGDARRPVRRGARGFQGPAGSSGGGSGSTHHVVFDTPGVSVWTVPTGTNLISIQTWGGGGGSAITHFCDVSTQTYCICNGGGGGAFAMATYNLTGVTQLTIDVGTAGIAPVSGGATFVRDADTSGTLIDIGASGGVSDISIGACTVGSDESNMIETSANPTTPSVALGGDAIEPDGLNLQVNSALSLAGGSSTTAYTAQLVNGANVGQMSVGGTGGSSPMSGPGGNGGVVVCSADNANYCIDAGGHPTGPGQGGGGAAVAASTGYSGGPIVINLLSNRGGVGMVILQY